MARRKSFNDLKLDVGCGSHKHDGFTGMDIRDVPGVDIIHDANVVPWPFPDDCAQTVIMAFLMEYLDPARTFSVFDDIWRISKPGANLLVSSHYAGSYLASRDPSIIRTGFNEDWPYYFDPTQKTSSGEYLYDSYKPKPWEILQVEYRLGVSVAVVLRPFKSILKKYSISKKQVIPKRV